MNTRFDGRARARHHGGRPGRQLPQNLLALCSLAVALVLLAGPGWGQKQSAAEQQKAAAAEFDRRSLFTEDVVAAAPLAGTDQILGVGEFGMVALIEFHGLQSKAQIVETETIEDLMDVVALDDGTALIAGAQGNVLRYADGQIEVVQNIGIDSVLSISAQRNASGKIKAIWASGGRGILARSRDGGKTFEDVRPERVTQPPLTLPNTNPGVWYTGAANVFPDSVKLEARVNGRPVAEGKDFIFTPEDGILEVLSELDASPAPAISFEYNPGPPFQAGDFTMSTVIFQGDLVTVAGEFGIIMQTEDDGATWVRRAGKLTPRDPPTPYWISAAAAGDTILLVGAAGAVHRSDDRGDTWTVFGAPAGNSGVFGAYMPDPSKPPVVVGAVGLLGEYDGGWQLVDRSAVQLYSWLRSIMNIGDGTVLALGGRGSCIFRKGGDWERCRIRLTDGNA